MTGTLLLMGCSTAQFGLPSSEGDAESGVDAVAIDWVSLDTAVVDDATADQSPTDASGPAACEAGAHRLLVTDFAVCVARADQSVWCLDRVDCGFCMGGAPGGLPHQVPSLPPVKELAGNKFLACALAADGRVFCWGQDNTLGDPVHPEMPQQVAGIPPLARLVRGPSFGVCGVTDAGAIYCWLQPGVGACLDLAGPLTTPKLVPLDGTRGVASDYAGICAEGADGVVRCCRTIYGDPPAGGFPYVGPFDVAELAGARGLGSGIWLCGVTETGAPRCALTNVDHPVAWVPSPAASMAQMGPVRTALSAGPAYCFAACDDNVYCTTAKCVESAQPDVVQCIDGDLHPIAIPGASVDLEAQAGTVCSLTASEDVWCWSVNGDFVLGGSKVVNAPELLQGLGH